MNPNREGAEKRAVRRAVRGQRQRRHSGHLWCGRGAGAWTTRQPGRRSLSALLVGTEPSMPPAGPWVEELGTAGAAAAHVGPLGGGEAGPERTPHLHNRLVAVVPHCRVVVHLEALQVLHQAALQVACRQRGGAARAGHAACRGEQCVMAVHTRATGNWLQGPRGGFGAASGGDSKSAVLHGAACTGAGAPHLSARS